MQQLKKWLHYQKRDLALQCLVFDKMYASYDLDVLDPAFAPGVGNPEATGITSRELFERAFTN